MSLPVSGTQPTINSLCAGLDLPESVLNFTDVPGGEVVFGSGTLLQIGAKAAAHGGTRVLIVSDNGILATGHPERAAESIREAGLDVKIFSEVHENPETTDVYRCVEVAKEFGADFLVGLGGGSSMDTAKGANFILTNGGKMRDYWGVGKAEKPMLPMIAVPTTSGTGSECQSFALIADSETHAKMACGDKKAAAVVAILDPELTLTQPRSVTVHTGIDAISHSLETAVCRKRTPTSVAYSKAAWKLLNEGFERVLEKPDCIQARAQMLLGSAFAGTAIENSMLGIAHSCANPLTANFGTVHGQAVGVMLPHTIRFNRQDAESAAIYEEFGGSELDARIEELLSLAGMKTDISSLGVTADKIEQLGEEAATQWTAQFNPVEVTAADLVEIYRKAL